MRTSCNSRIFSEKRNHFTAFGSTQRHQWFREWFRRFYLILTSFPALGAAMGGSVAIARSFSPCMRW